MTRVRTFKDFSRLVQSVLDSDERRQSEFGIQFPTQLKAYLIEARGTSPLDQGSPHGPWTPLDSKGWFVAEADTEPNTFYLDATDPGVWKVYSLRDATESHKMVEKWVAIWRGLDHCWLTRAQLLHWEGQTSWQRRGLGLKFSDGLTPEEDQENFSLKAWYGASHRLASLESILSSVQDQFAINSVRWQKVSGGSVTLSAEWYSDGTVTFNRASSIEDAMLAVTSMANRYSDELARATELRNSSLGAFEVDFSQPVGLEAFSNVTAKGAAPMRLWLVETETSDQIRRFSGVDMHTWDRVLIDLGADHAFVTVPGSGCVNAVPRIAILQGEDNAGKTEILFDGDPVFA
jgi:hypothetical protein